MTFTTDTVYQHTSLNKLLYHGKLLFHFAILILKLCYRENSTYIKTE